MSDQDPIEGKRPSLGGQGISMWADWAVEEHDPIVGRMQLEALNQRRVRWSLARTLLFEMEVADLELVAGEDFLSEADLGISIRGGELLEELSPTEKRILQEMAQVMLEIMRNGGPLSEREAKEIKGGLRNLIDEADLDQGRLRLGMERKRDFRGRRTDMTTVRTDFPDVGDDLEDIIEAGRVDVYPSVRKMDKRGRWAKARRVIMGMGREELLILAAESYPVDGQTPITDGIGRLVARLLPRERMVIWEFAKTILQIGVGPGAFSGEELETELYYQGLGEECPSGDEKETEMRNIE